MRGIGDFACNDQLIQPDRSRTESPARSIFAMQSITLLKQFFLLKGSFLEKLLNAIYISEHTILDILHRGISPARK